MDGWMECPWCGLTVRQTRKEDDRPSDNSRELLVNRRHVLERKDDELCIPARRAAMKPRRITSDDTSVGAREKKKKRKKPTAAHQLSKPSCSYTVSSLISPQITPNTKPLEMTDVSYFSGHCILMRKWWCQCHDYRNILKAGTLHSIPHVHAKELKPSAFLSAIWSFSSTQIQKESEKSLQREKNKTGSTFWAWGIILLPLVCQSQCHEHILGLCELMYADSRRFPPSAPFFCSYNVKNNRNQVVSQMLYDIKSDYKMLKCVTCLSFVNK